MSDTKQEIDLSDKETRKAEIKTANLIKKRNFLQYSGAFIIIVLMLLLLNYTINIQLPPLVVKGVAFLTVLTLFEFSLVYLDPTIESFTQSEPLKKLGLNVLIAAFIFPLHSFIETRMNSVRSKP